MSFVFRDINSGGEMETYLGGIEDPAFLVSIKGEYRILYGEFDDLIAPMIDYDGIEKVAIIGLPKNQEDVDKIFQSTGLTQKLIQDWKKRQNIE